MFAAGFDQCIFQAPSSKNLHQVRANRVSMSSDLRLQNRDDPVSQISAFDFLLNLKGLVIILHLYLDFAVYKTFWLGSCPSCPFF